MKLIYKNSKLFMLFVFVRICSVFVVQTYFVPDEYWQSLEVAHKFVFGYGHLTWEWREGIRSSAYPLVFAAAFKFLRICGIDNSYLIVFLPRILQACLSALGDLFTCLLSQKLQGSRSAKWTAFSLLSSWFLFYCSSRTLINSTEMAVMAVAFYYYPWTTKHSKMTSSCYLSLAAVTCVLRPTAAVTWVPLYLWHLARLSRSHIICFLSRTFYIGIASLGVLVLLDYSFYGRWLFTPWNFFYWNWTLNVGEFYGQHAWHWYLSQGLPAVLSGHVLLFLYGMHKRQLWPMYFIVFYFVASLSVVSHKEFRFLLPVFPAVNLICGRVLSDLSRRFQSSWVNRSLVLFLLLSNIPLAVYLGRWHKRGQLEVMDFLRESGPRSSVLFLMPCHSTPFYSHIHQTIEMRFLTCEPKIQDRTEKIEADDFFKNPEENTGSFINSASPPTHLVMFDTLLPKVKRLLQDYEECFRAFNNHIEENKEVFVFCRK